MMNEVADILVKAAATLLAAGITYLCKVAGSCLMEWAKEKKLDKAIKEGTAAAEQLFRKTDDVGDKRLAYVQQLLIEAGYELTEAIRAKIEANVFKINNGGVQ